MTLPRRPTDHSAPIPNEPFEHPELYYVSAPQGEIIPIGNGLEVDPETGEIKTA